MKIGFLGSGTWGFTLASLLAAKKFDITLWSHNQNLVAHLHKTREHPKLPHCKAHPNVAFTHNLQEALSKADILIEAVTSVGLRPVLEQALSLQPITCPLVITSKGIEQNSCLLMPEVAIDVLGSQYKMHVGCLSGPSHAEEVIHRLPTSVVCSSYSAALTTQIHDIFSTPLFRVYPNADLHGVCFGGAMKNIIAIACGISDGLGFGDNTKAALMTRGLHEIRKLSVTKEAIVETLNGLAGLGDLCVTCLSKHSRNYTFGRYIAEGLDPQMAKEKIGMVVEGAYACVSAMQLAQQSGIAVPITEAIYAILHNNLNPRDAVKQLLQRAIKEEHL